ncbi:ferritin-like domain-containing protein [Lysobacter sp. HDW10]|uniref:ferritin-like domain-containing protein n=1 Tax=Lysobacter sp. HDW10 TaxID=2714936 RepID=UPI00140D0CAF|nr:ferritin-like domain-containing protein [Lysobacter sp. HDW10]QIK81360.1 ferritin-like domain-containing protein [Lysobacter sp. HDW10]
MEAAHSDDLFEVAFACLSEGGVEAKPALTRAAAAAFARGELHRPVGRGEPLPIKMPGRPEKPELVEPKFLRKRGFGTDEGKAAFIHAVAHIEFNAIDLAWDAVYRFRNMPDDYYRDWIQVADDEARHFTMLRARLQSLGYDYGDFPAHNGLWEMAEKTAHSGLARMALVPRVLEARGLDVTPGMIERLKAQGDVETTAILEIILAEEVSHVAHGSKWFRWWCEREGVDSKQTFKTLLEDYARNVLHGPYNRAARLAAGFDEDELKAIFSI